MITQAICFLNLTYKIMCSETFPFCSSLFEGVKVDQCQPSNTASGTGPAGPRVLQASLQLWFPWHQSLLSIPRTAGWPIGCDQSLRQFLSNARCNVSCRRPSVSVAIRWRCWERRKRNQVSREAGLGRGKKWKLQLSKQGSACLHHPAASFDTRQVFVGEKEGR